MAETYRGGATATVHKWVRDFQSEFVRIGPLQRFTSADGSNVIKVDATSLSDSGESVNFPFVNALRGDGVSGNTALTGFEEAGNSDSHRIFTEWRRNGTLCTEKEKTATMVDLFEAYRSALMNWAQELQLKEFVTALLSMGYQISTTSKSIVNHAWYNYGYPTDGVTVTPGSTGVAGTTQKNNYAAYNSGRLLFGASTSNYSATWATALGNIDTSADKMTYSIMDIAKTLIQDSTLNPRISPYTGDGTKYTEETYVCFHHPIAFQFLRDSLMGSGGGYILQQAEQRGKDNPLFAGGDLYWNGIIHTSVPLMPTLTGGNSSSLVVPSFLCGRNSLGLAWGKMPTPKTQTDDYEFRKGISVEMKFGLEKLLYFNTSTNYKVQQCISIFTSAGY